MDLMFEIEQGEYNAMITIEDNVDPEHEEAATAFFAEQIKKIFAGKDKDPVRVTPMDIAEE